MQLLFTWSLPITIVMGFCMLSFIPYLVSPNSENTLQINNLRLMPQQDLFLLVVIILNVFIHEAFTLSTTSAIGMSVPLMTIVTTFFVTIASYEFKSKLYKSLDFFLKFLCLISLLGWFGLMFGLSLPHYHTVTNDYYDHEVYYLFLFNRTEFEFLPRFAGQFLEPGHLGSTCCMMLFINRYNLRKLSNWIYLVSIAMSFSLAAYCLFCIGLFLYFYFSGKKVLMKLLLALSFVGALYVFAITYNNGENDVNNRIFARLEFVNGKMVGNNRTAPVFDSYYNNWLDRGDVFLGFGRGNLQRHKELQLGTAGYQRFLFQHGFLGVILVFLLYAMIFMRDRSRLGFGFALLYIICNFIRDYPYRPLWLLTFVLAIPILASKEETELLTENKEKNDE